MHSGGPLIGREGVLADLRHLLGTSRILTVTGPGGCGKSRLANELVALASSADTGLERRLVELAVVEAWDRSSMPYSGRSQPASRGGRTSLETLLEDLAGRRVLLVLDNCEHLRPEIGTLVAALVEGVQGLRLLVTSREPLGIPHETVFRLGPLSLPGGGGDVAAVVRSDAGRMFVDRAVAINPAFALTPSVARAVIRICHELDGLPSRLRWPQQGLR